MSSGAGEVVPFAIAIAVSPIPIIAVVLVLFSQRARRNGPSFLVGWAAGLLLLSLAGYALARAVTIGSQDTSTSVGWLRIGLGTALLVLAVRQFSSESSPTPPRMLAGIEEISPLRALRLGVILSSLNPKNLALCVPAMIGLAQQDLSVADAAVGIGVFVLVGSSSIAGAVSYYLAGGATARERLDKLRQWMARHSNAVMGVLLVIFGVALIAQGIPSAN